MRNAIVSVQTSGVHFDADGYLVSHKSGGELSVDVNGFVTIEDVQTGDVVKLGGAHETCTIEGGGSQTIALPETGDASIEFDVACPPRTVLVDEGHLNVHRLSTTLANLATLLRFRGYQVISIRETITLDALSEGDVLVISNALHPNNMSRWAEPIEDAFSTAESEAVKSWVDSGGGLLLIADHMPFPAAADIIAEPFGIKFNNGFAFDTLQIDQPQTCLAPADAHVFRRDDGTLGDHAITQGRNENERVASVATFTGQAFQTPDAAVSLLRFNDSSVSLMPEVAWEFNPDTPRLKVGGWSQGAVLASGEGRAAFFGEAAMFTVQTCGSAGHPMGFQASGVDTKEFVLNVINWLARVID